ncbi:MAG TPA: hypothetical protein VHJ82_02595 [Actinomycetota bacterium]|nr:hypothetical protein [Actinomycetota bacterium]
MRLAAAAAFDQAPVEWRVTADEAQAASADVVVATPDVQWPAAVSFDPEQPDALLPAVRARLARGALGRLYVVTSPRAGSGATTLALELAARAAWAGKACFVDRDPTGGAVARLGLASAVPSTRTNDPPATVPLQGGIRLLRCPAQEADDADVYVIRTLSEFDTVVVDAGRIGADDAVVTRARAVLVVIAATASCASAAGELLEGLRDRPTALVANHTGWGGEVNRAELERLAGHRVTAELPFSAAVRDAERDGLCSVPRWTSWSRRVGRLYQALERL